MSLESYILLLCFLGLTICSSIQLNKTEPFQLSIIHFSDFHARFFQVSLNGGNCYEEDKCHGGIARIATTVEKLKKIRKNPIVLNAGDSFQGTLYYELFKGNITARFMNKLHPDVHTIGNHDFDDEILGLATYVKELNSPVVVTNIDDSEEPLIQNLYTNSTIIRKGNKDIGVIGVIYSDTDKLSTTLGKVKFLNEVETVKLEAQKLKARGIEIIIVLSHCGIEHDKIIAANCPDIDVIVGGHSHILLYNGLPPSGESYGNYPLIVSQPASNRTVLIVHAGAYTEYLGDLQVIFDDKGEVSRWMGNPIYLDKVIEKDPSYVRELKPWKDEVDRVGKRVIGETLVYLNGTCYSGECNLANLITDAMIDNYANESSVSLLPASSIQNNIRKGSILYEDLFMVLPYHTTWNLIELKGSDLLRVLEENIENSSSNETLVNYLLIHWSGLRVVYKLTNEQSKVVSVDVRCLNCRTRKYEKLQNDQWYRIVVPNYLCSRTFETIFTKHRLITKGKTVDVENLISYVEKQKVINVTTESRMIIINGSQLPSCTTVTYVVTFLMMLRVIFIL